MQDHESKSLLSRIVTWTVIGIVAVLAVRLLLSLLGAALVLAGFLIFTVAPLLFIGWLALKAYNAFTREPTT